MAILGSHANLHHVPHALRQIAEPGARLRHKLLPPPRQNLQRIKSVDQRFRPPFLIAERLPLRPQDLSLNAILMKASKEFFEVGRQMELMEAEGLCLSKV